MPADTSNASQIALKKPVALLKREMTFDWKNIFIKSGKTVGNFFVKGVDGAALSAGDLLNDIGLKQQKEELAWLLVFQAMMSNLNTIINDSRDLFNALPSDEDKTKLGERLSLTLANPQYFIDNNFFDQPHNAQFIKDFIRPFRLWLETQGLNHAESQALSNRFKANLPLCLHNQWADNSELFAVLTQTLATPFSQANERQQQWRNYHLWLKTQINERMFGEAFSLNDVYIKPNAYYIVKNKHIKVELYHELTEWAQNFNANDAFRVISGLPGAGKSSMAKMLAVEWAETLHTPVVFIPLQHFKLGSSISSAMTEFTNRNRYLPNNLFEQQRVIFIFDGLDELAEQGKQTQEKAKDFVIQLVQEIRLSNSQNNQHQVIITGRDISTNQITSNFSEPKQHYHLQGFDEQQQNLWWQQYGTASGKDYQHMPLELKINRLKEIVSQPLLSYLVALSYVRGKIDFNQQTTLNEIYQDLLNSVYDREKDKNITNVAQELNKQQFSRILEEVALAVWHGDTGRTATVSAIEQQCNTSGLIKNLRAFEQGAEAGVTKLLTAFYFRQSSEQNNSDKTFEFTHKSFGEYLTAKRLVRLITKISTQLERKIEDPDDGWTAKEALTEWIKFTGPSAIDRYLHPFIKDEMLLAGMDKCQTWQQLLLYLLNHSINHGLPMEEINGLTYPQMTEQARNADEALLICLNACALVTEELSKIDAKDKTGFGTWFNRIQLQRKDDSNCVAYDCLSYLNLSHSILFTQDLFKTNLSYCNLSHGLFDLSIARCSNLKNTDLISANLFDVNLVQTNLTNANLTKADLTKADLTKADLTKADLTQADLTNTDLTDAYLLEANLTGANLTDAKVNFRNHDKSMFSEEQLKQIIVVDD